MGMGGHMEMAGMEMEMELGWRWRWEHTVVNVPVAIWEKLYLQTFSINICMRTGESGWGWRWGWGMGMAKTAGSRTLEVVHIDGLESLNLHRLFLSVIW